MSSSICNKRLAIINAIAFTTALAIISGYLPLPGFLSQSPSSLPTGLSSDRR